MCLNSLRAILSNGKSIDNVLKYPTRLKLKYDLHWMVVQWLLRVLSFCIEPIVKKKHTFMSKHATNVLLY